MIVLTVKAPSGADALATLFPDGAGLADTGLLSLPVSWGHDNGGFTALDLVVAGGFDRFALPPGWTVLRACRRVGAACQQVLTSPAPDAKLLAFLPDVVTRDAQGNETGRARPTVLAEPQRFAGWPGRF